MYVRRPFVAHQLDKIRQQNQEVIYEIKPQIESSYIGTKI